MLSNRKRYIFVGDIHGCYDELLTLMAKICPRAQDMVVCVGDFVDRGPGPHLCLEYWKDNRYLALLGNHDDRIVRWSRGKEVPNGEDLDRTIKLVGHRNDLIDYLDSLPLTLHIPEINVVVVHAALDVNESLTTQLAAEINRDIFLRGRYVRKSKSVWSYIQLGKNIETDVIWADIWQGPALVIYGHTPNHDGKPKISPYAIGIDTACAYGKTLTAVIYDSKLGWIFESAAAKSQYWKPATKYNMVVV